MLEALRGNKELPPHNDEAAATQHQINNDKKLYLGRISPKRHLRFYEFRNVPMGFHQIIQRDKENGISPLCRRNENFEESSSK